MLGSGISVALKLIWLTLKLRAPRGAANHILHSIISNDKRSILMKQSSGCAVNGRAA